ncbi:MAG TPA: tetratricopeptide repeat protein, partial [Longimicrobiaceae bacterium]|nr:tetratricopeptide repeat protein [Longimicrobiaceae bacterium]
MAIPTDGSIVVPGPALPRTVRDEMLAELRERGLPVAGALLVVTLTALHHGLRNGEGAVPSVRDALAGLEVGLQPPDLDGTMAGVAQDCADVATWLQSRGALLTACGYAEAAAALQPNAERALAVAGLARRSGRMAHAAGWGVRAVRLAGRAGDTDARAAALVALGHTACDAQRYGEAERLFAVARRYARSRGAAEREGDALRGLALVRHAQERDEEALGLVLDALAAYGSRTACVRALARTLLALWLGAGEYRGVLALGRHLLALPLSAGDELSVCALCARAAAALGWELHYESACLRAILALGMLPA